MEVSYKTNNVYLGVMKQIMNVFIGAMVRLFSFGERQNVPINSALPRDWNSPFSPHENILTVALINIYYLYTVAHGIIVSTLAFYLHFFILVFVKMVQVHCLNIMVITIISLMIRGADSTTNCKEYTNFQYKRYRKSNQPKNVLMPSECVAHYSSFC